METTQRVERPLRIGAVLLATAWASAGMAQVVQPMLPGTAIPKWVDPLPRLEVQRPSETPPAPPWTIPTLPGYGAGDPPAPGELELHMCEVKAHVLPTGTFAPGVKPVTWAWGYVAGACPRDTADPRDTYIGPVIVARRGTPTQVTYVNELGHASSTNVIAYQTSTDQTLHWADPLGLDCMMQAAMSMWEMPDADPVMSMYPPHGSKCSWNYAGAIAAVPHLHGGEIPAEIDGSPDSWFTSDGQHGPKYYTKDPESTSDNAAVYTYPNVQEGAPLWFHDHTLGATRLNVYAGLAGGYYLVDPQAPIDSTLLPVGEVIPLVIQDRMFDADGQLFFTAGLNGFDLQAASPGWALNPEHPYWNPEFVGDTIAVNGKVWPYVQVEPRRQRFLFLNGSNARTYELFITNPKTKQHGPSLWVIGTDGGYLDAPALIDPYAAKPNPTKLVIMPGERYEVIIDFTGFDGQTLVMRNVAKTPYPAGAVPSPATVGQILQFRVNTCAVRGCGDTSFDPAAPGAMVRTMPMARLVDPGAATPKVAPALVRQLTLNEVMGMPMTATNPINGTQTAYPGGPLEILVNNTKWAGHGPMQDPRADFQTRTETGDTLAYSEVPNEGDVEVWELVNLTADAHPIHLHLVQFQILNRQALDVPKYAAAYGLAFPAGCTPKDGTGYCPGYGPPLAYAPQAFTRSYPVASNVPVVGGNPDVTPFLKSFAQPAAPHERGWKDTVQSPPGTVTRLIVRWAPTGQQTFAFDPSGAGKYNYVWHCHIIDHEDNEMMRPDFVSPAREAERTFTRGSELTNY